MVTEIVEGDGFATARAFNGREDGRGTTSWRWWILEGVSHTAGRVRMLVRPAYGGKEKAGER